MLLGKDELKKKNSVTIIRTALKGHFSWLPGPGIFFLVNSQIGVKKELGPRNNAIASAANHSEKAVHSRPSFLNSQTYSSRVALAT